MSRDDPMPSSEATRRIGRLDPLTRSRRDVERGQEFARLRRRGMSLQDIGDRFGVTRQCVSMTLMRHGYRIAPPIPVKRPVPERRKRDGLSGNVARIFCQQCDRSVLVEEGRRCSAPFCKGKVE